MFNKKLTEKEVDYILENDEHFSLDDLFSYAPFMVCAVNKKGFLTKVNMMFCDILGYTCEELTTTPFIEFVHPEDKDKTVRAYLEGDVFNEDAEHYKGFQNRYVTKGGDVANWSGNLLLRD